VLSVYLLMADALNSALAGLGRYDLVSYCQLIGQLLTVLTAVALFELHYGVWSLLIANALDAVFINVVSLVLIRRITRSGSWIRFTWDLARLRRILNFGSWVFGANLLNTVIYPLNKIFITRLAGVGAVPVYDLSFATCFKVRSFFEGGFRSLTPEFSSLNSIRPDDARRTLASADRKGVKAILYWGTVVYLPVFVFCGWGLRIWLGARFTPELPTVFRIMLLGTYLSLWGLQPWYSLLGFGRSRHIFLSNAAQAIANIGLVLLWPAITQRSVTLTGVTWATSFGLFASTSYLRWQGRRLGADRLKV
jgi:O-antigen/teichoic acid export membrane protein